MRAGLANFTRNGFVSLAAILIMVVTLFFIGSVLLMITGLNVSLQGVKDKVDINVYFATTAEESDILTLKKTIEVLPEVKRVGYTSSDQALADFKQKHDTDQLTLQALGELGANPLGAVLNIKANDPSQYEIIANFLKGDNVLSKNKKVIIDKVNYYDNKAAIDKLTKIIRAAERLGLAAALILVLISLIIAFNTIRLAIYVAREEISVMRLVGANNKYIRGPFVVAGIFYGLTAGLITIVLFYPLTYWLRSSTESFFGGLNFFVYYVSHFGQLFLLLVGSGIVLGAVSSYLAVRRYLKI
jgi:cell division transport system permease protein